MNAVIYARYSSDNQREESIDGQIRECMEYCSRNGMTVIKEYIDNMYTCMCASDLIITRAGAMTLTEIMAIGRASVLIPYPYAAENHQYYNALTLQNANAGRIIDDKELTGSVLIDTVNRLADDPELLRLMSENAAKLSKRDAAGKILREITELMGIK